MYIRLIGQTPEKYSQDQLRRDVPNTSFPATIPETTLAEYDVYPLAAAQKPEPVGNTKVVEGTPALVEGQWTQTWQQVPLTPEELQAMADQRAAERVAEKQQKSVAALEVVAAIVLKPLLEGLPDEDLEQVTSLFPDFVVGEVVAVGDIRNFEDILYEVIQPHTTQADWTPPVVPALWRRVKSPNSNEWVAGIAVTVGEVYTHLGVSYTVVQSHTTQVGWEPPNVPALWSANP